MLSTSLSTCIRIVSGLHASSSIFSFVGSFGVLGSSSSTIVIKGGTERYERRLGLFLETADASLENSSYSCLFLSSEVWLMISRSRYIRTNSSNRTLSLSAYTKIIVDPLNVANRDVNFAIVSRIIFECPNWLGSMDFTFSICEVSKPR